MTWIPLWLLNGRAFVSISMQPKSVALLVSQISSAYCTKILLSCSAPSSKYLRCRIEMVNSPLSTLLLVLVCCGTGRLRSSIYRPLLFCPWACQPVYNKALKSKSGIYMRYLGCQEALCESSHDNGMYDDKSMWKDLSLVSSWSPALKESLMSLDALTLRDIREINKILPVFNGKFSSRRSADFVNLPVPSDSAQPPRCIWNLFILTNVWTRRQHSL